MNNDLISREALKEELSNLWNYDADYSIFKQIETLIDNAPTVAVNCKDCDGYEAGYSAGSKDAERPQGDIFPMKLVAGKCPIEAGGNCPLKSQGEWIKWNFKTFGAFGDWEYKCSNCEKVYGGEYNFCPNCGADMKGGAK